MSESAETIRSRISQILQDEQLTPNGLAAVLRNILPGYKLSHTTVKRYIEGEYLPKEKFYIALNKAFGYSKLWVQHGIGEPKVSSDIVQDVGELEQIYTTDKSAALGYGGHKKEKSMTPNDFDRLREAQMRLKMAQEQMNLALAEIAEITKKGITLTIKKKNTEVMN